MRASWLPLLIIIIQLCNSLNWSWVTIWQSFHFSARTLPYSGPQYDPHPSIAPLMVMLTYFSTMHKICCRSFDWFVGYLITNFQQWKSRLSKWDENWARILRNRVFVVGGGFSNLKEVLVRQTLGKNMISNKTDTTTTEIETYIFQNINRNIYH